MCIKQELSQPVTTSHRVFSTARTLSASIALETSAFLMANVPPNWQIYFRVPDVHAAAERITANGGKILNGPMEVPGGDWIVNAMDPQGAAFGLHAKN